MSPSNEIMSLNYIHGSYWEIVSDASLTPYLNPWRISGPVFKITVQKENKPMKVRYGQLQWDSGMPAGYRKALWSTGR